MSARSHAARIAVAVLLLAGCRDTTGPEPGSINVLVTTVGGDRDDSYEILIGSDKRVLDLSGVTTIDDVGAGRQTLELSGVADNCDVDGENPRSVDIVSDTTITVSFAVRCDATGISIIAITTGPDRPYLGYELTSGGRSVRMAADDTAFLTRMSSGRHRISMSSIADGCTVAGGASWDIDVAHRKVTPIALNVACGRTDKRISFVMDSLIGFTVKQTVFVASSNGRGIPAELAFGRDPAWSPDRRRMVYTTTSCDYYYRSGCTGGLVVRDLETGGETKPNYGAAAINPAWSPDGTRIAFARNQVEFPALAIADEAGVATELNILGLNSASSPSWSPDGERLVFVCGSVRWRTDICVAGKDGSNLRFLTDDLQENYSPKWSPDGSRIVYGASEAGMGQVIKLINPDGTGLSELTAGNDPAWSPDGTKVIFALFDGLYTIDVSGTNRTRVTTGKHRAPVWLP